MAGSDVELGVRVTKKGNGAEEVAQELKQAARAADDLSDNLNQAARSGEKLLPAAKAADELGDQLNQSARAADHLSDELGQVQRRLVEIRAEKALAAKTLLDTGDKAPLRKLLGEERDLKQVEKAIQGVAGEAERAFEKVGKQAGEDLEGGLAGALRDFQGASGAILPAAIAVAITEGAPAIGAAVSAAVLLGVGGGGLAAGIVAAAQDDRVQRAFGVLAAGVAASGKSLGEPFVRPLESAAVRLQIAFRGLFPELQHGLAAIAPTVDHLAQGVAGLIQNVGPGLSRALVAAAPLLDELAAQLPRIGIALGDFLDSMASAGPGAEKFFHALLQGAEGFIEILGDVTEGLSKLFDGLTEPTALIELLGPLGGLLDGVDAFGAHSKKAFEDSALAATNARSAHVAALNEISAAAESSTVSIQGMTSALDALFHKELEGKNAHLAVQQGFLDLTESLKQNKGAWDENSEAGIRHRQAILSQLSALEAERVATINATGDQKAANAAYEAGAARVYDLAAKYGITRSQVDQYAGALRSVPTVSETEVKANGLGIAKEDAKELSRTLWSLDGMSVSTYVTTYFRSVNKTTDAAGNVHIGSRIAFAEGGIYPGAATGLIADRPMLVGERTVPEAAIPAPNSGISSSRAAGLLGTAASWWGMGVVPKGGGGASGDINVNVSLYDEEERLIRRIRYAVQNRGGDVQTVLGGR